MSTFVAQEGGDHYQNEYQHWDWVIDIGMGYLPGNATKYVSRWRKKNGLADLKKALTYVDKMIAIRSVKPRAKFSDPIGNGYASSVLTERFVADMGDLERSFCTALSYKCDDGMLRAARGYLLELIQSAQRTAGAAGAGAAPALPATPGKPAPAPAGGALGASTGTTTQPPASVASEELSKSQLSKRVDHPAPFGYEGDE